MAIRGDKSRRQEILEALVSMLEKSPRDRITTAQLAAELQVSEAALYRHFPSKARMFEGLLDYIEDILFAAIDQILKNETDVASRCGKIVGLLLTFAARNPGLCRVLAGDALVGEDERLPNRVNQIFERVEMQIRQVLREAAMNPQAPLNIDAAAAANLFTAVAEGRIRQFVRSGLKQLPTAGWDEQWPLLARTLG